MTLTFDGVSFRYRRGRAEVLREVGFSLGPGRCVLLGPNGAGKSTLLGLAVGLLTPSRGRVMITPGRGVGWLPQQVRPLAGCTAREQVAYVGWLRGLSRSAAWEAAPVALARVGMETSAEVKASELSGGQLRRVGIAAALVADPEVLLLDEPFAGLDPRERHRLRSVVAGLADEMVTVISTHLVDDVDELYRGVVVLDRGAVRFEGPVERFLAMAPEGTPHSRRAEAAYLACTTVSA